MPEPFTAGSRKRIVAHRQPSIVNRQAAIFGLLALVLLLAVTAILPGGLELVIRPADGGRPIFAAPLEPGERFTLHYVHSVDHAPIWEEHSVDRQGTIYIEEERFVMFGAGMGHWPGHGSLTRRGPYQVIENIHRPLGEFTLRVGGAGVDHTLIWRDASVNLSRLAPGQAVVVSARPVSRGIHAARDLSRALHTARIDRTRGAP